MSSSHGSRGAGGQGGKSEKGETRFYQKSGVPGRLAEKVPRCFVWWSSGDNLAVMGTLCCGAQVRGTAVYRICTVLMYCDVFG